MWQKKVRLAYPANTNKTNKIGFYLEEKANNLYTLQRFYIQNIYKCIFRLSHSIVKIQTVHRRRDIGQQKRHLLCI